jgi:hypothetical protein
MNQVWITAMRCSSETVLSCGRRDGVDRGAWATVPDARLRSARAGRETRELPRYDRTRDGGRRSPIAGRRLPLGTAAGRSRLTARLRAESSWLETALGELRAGGRLRTKGKVLERFTKGVVLSYRSVIDPPGTFGYFRTACCWARADRTPGGSDPAQNGREGMDGYPERVPNPRRDRALRSGTERADFWWQFRAQFQQEDAKSSEKPVREF